MNNKLNIQSIFDSIDGEANGFDGAGQLCTFIRLKGCNLHCQWCDTKYAQESEPANWMTIDEIVSQVHFPKVTITGGDPFIQPEGLAALVLRLTNKHKSITIETNGSLDIPEGVIEHKLADLDAKLVGPNTPVRLCSHYTLVELQNVRLVVDFKLSSSGMMGKMDRRIFEKLRSVDVVKFVIADENDYKQALEVISWLPGEARKVMSPAIEIKEAVLPFRFISEGFWCKASKDIKIVDPDWPRQLVEMMIRDRVPAQFSLQLHKLIWPGVREER